MGKSINIILAVVKRNAWNQETTERRPSVGGSVPLKEPHHKFRTLKSPNWYIKRSQLLRAYEPIFFKYRKLAYKIYLDSRDTFLNIAYVDW